MSRVKTGGIVFLAFLLTGCQSWFIPREGLQGGSNVAYEAREWYENGQPKSHCVISRDSLVQLPAGFTVDVEGDDKGGCDITYTAPEVVQGDASLTRETALSVEDLLNMARTLRALGGGDFLSQPGQ